MELIFHSIQGVASLLVIFQVLIVCGISLGLIAILIKKTKASYDVSLPANSLPTSSEGSVPLVEGKSFPVDTESDKKEVESLRLKIKSLEEENEKNKLEKSDSSGVQDKVRYLETKLLEYEILQEEISTLSSLKNENEQLKLRIQEFETGGSSVAPTKLEASSQPLNVDGDLELRKEPVSLKDPSLGGVPPEDQGGKQAA